MKNSAPTDIAIYMRGKGEVLREKSLIGFSGDKIVAFGNECDNIQNAAITGSETLKVISPLKQGAIDDFICTVKMLKYFLYKVKGKKSPFSRRPLIGLCVSENMTLVNMKAFEDAIYSVGARKCLIFHDPVEKVLDEWQSGDKKEIDIIIEIGKENPLEYLEEKISDVLDFAQKHNISKETVRELLDK